jgi:hypothetical protein
VLLALDPLARLRAAGDAPQDRHNFPEVVAMVTR